MPLDKRHLRHLLGANFGDALVSGDHLHSKVLNQSFLLDLVVLEAHYLLLGGPEFVAFLRLSRHRFVDSIALRSDCRRNPSQC